MSTVNLSELLNVRAKDVFEPPDIPPGTYRCKVISFEGVISSSGNPMLRVIVRPFEAVDVDMELLQAAGGPGRLVNYKIYHNFMIDTEVKENNWRIRNFLVDIGVIDKEDEGAIHELLPNSIGVVFLAQVGFDPPSEGSDRAWPRIKKFMAE